MRRPFKICNKTGTIVLTEIIDYLKAMYQPHALVLHGSRARGDYFDNSDYDIFVFKSPAAQEVNPIIFQGQMLDLDGIIPDQTFILKADNVPIWPLEVLYDDHLQWGKKIAGQTHQAYLTGPTALNNQGIENRKNYCTRLLGRLKNRGHDQMVRMYYITDFYTRVIRYWCEQHHRWTTSAYLILPMIKAEDPKFYRLLTDLFDKGYLRSAYKICELLFYKEQNAE